MVASHYQVVIYSLQRIVSKHYSFKEYTFITLQCPLDGHPSTSSWLTASHKAIIQVSARGAVISKLVCGKTLFSALSSGCSQDLVAHEVLAGALSYFLATWSYP